MSPLLSIGHSNHEIATFLGLLSKHHVEVLVDIRSYPYSQYSSQFDKPALEKSLAGIMVRYLHIPELGGRPDGTEFYDPGGHVLYGAYAKTDKFKRGLDRLRKGIAKFKVALMCSEEDPTACHRRLLVGRVLVEEGIEVVHIRGDGHTQTEEEVGLADKKEAERKQMGLFEDLQEQAWKSIPSVWEAPKSS